MRSVFYCLKQNGKYIFDKNEKHHINVLRIKLPSTLLFTTGDGVLYSGKVDPDYNILSHRIIKETSNEFINIFFGICEKSRMKYILEKCTELGVRSFTPLFTDNSEKFHFKQDRANKIIRSAVKQSRRFVVPQYNEAMNIYDIESTIIKNSFFGSIENTSTKMCIDKKEINIFVGPPSGFSEREEEFLIERGAKGFHLDTGILRTETFCVSIVSILHYLKGG